MSFLVITGAEDFARLSRELKKAGRQVERRELFRALNSGTKQARADVLASIPAHLPDGYATVLQGDLKMSTTASGTKNPAIKVRAQGRKKKRRVGPIDRGRLRHPLFGNRHHWFDQQVIPGFFTETMRGNRDQIQARIEERMSDVLQQIARRT